MNIGRSGAIALKLGEDGRSSLYVYAVPAAVFFEEVAAAFSDSVIGTTLKRDSSPKGWEESFEKVLVDRRIELAVEDRGPGIPAGKQELVFEPFERLRSDLREGVSGTGIGLTISRELAQLQGGTLRVDSTLRGGALGGTPGGGHQCWQRPGQQTLPQRRGTPQGGGGAQSPLCAAAG
jgi:signal transduction histidine kinase